MSGSGRDDVKTLFPEVLTLATGVTSILQPIPGQLGVILKYVSGGSLGILRNPDTESGATTVGASFATSGLYTVGSAEVLNVSLAGPLYLFATGATCIANVLRLRSTY